MKIAALSFAPLLLLAGVAMATDPPTNDAQAPAAEKKQEQPAQPQANAAPDANAQPGANAATPAPVTAPDTTPPGVPGGKAATTPTAAAQPSPEAAKAQAALARIRARAGELDAKSKDEAEKSLKEAAGQIDAANAKKANVEVAGRLAAEYGGIPELYVGEHDRLKTGWGELAIAHTILSSTKTTVTIDQLYDLRQEGLGWGQIAHGLDIPAAEFTKSAHAKALALGGGAATKSGDAVEAKADLKADMKAKAVGTMKPVAKAKAAKANGAAKATKAAEAAPTAAPETAAPAKK